MQAVLTTLVGTELMRTLIINGGHWAKEIDFGTLQALCAKQNLHGGPFAHS